MEDGDGGGHGGLAYRGEERDLHSGVYDQPMATAVAPATTQSPPRLVFVYTWDILRAVGAIFGALAAFSGGFDAAGRQVAIPVWMQLVGALSAAAYAAALITVGALLGRRQWWVRR